LRQVRDGDEESRLAELPEEFVGYNAALLIDEGLVEGSAIRNNQEQPAD
jgi:hypothetical protein